VKNKIVLCIGTSLAIVFSGAVSADTIGNVTPDVIFGSGNANGSFTIDRSSGVELGLRGKLRHNPNSLPTAEQPANIFNSNGFVGPNGISTYSFDARQVPGQALGTAEWSFEWSINTNYDGSNTNDPLANNLDNYTYQLGIDLDSSQGVDFAFSTFDPINGLNPNFAQVRWDHAIGTNSTANGGGGNYVASTGTYSAALQSNNVAQNSWKPHWFIPGFDPTANGTYNFFLAAFDANGLVTRTDMQIIVGAGGAVVPVPAAAPLGLLGMGIVAFVRRRKNAKA